MHTMARILLVDHERKINAALREILEIEGHDVEEAYDGRTALERLKVDRFDIVICEAALPKLSGLRLIVEGKQVEYPPQFIVLTSSTDSSQIVEYIKSGAYEYLQKPPSLNQLMRAIRSALPLVERNSKEWSPIIGDEIIAQSEAMKRVKNLVEMVAPTNAKVLITGPSGAGKEIVANQIHQHSGVKGPLVVVDCANLMTDLVESELFGHEKGAFTSAIKTYIGKFEQADSGTLFFDEIGELNLVVQAKLLRVLQENKIKRLGSNLELKVNARIISATSKNLITEIKEGRFREDLYHRLNVISIDLPRLCERQDDIPFLIEKFISDYTGNQLVRQKPIQANAIEYLKTLPWLGNGWELKNTIERLMIMCKDGITLADVKNLSKNYV
ncbi:sigma-54 dependent transcriptional regulator [Spirosoma gilvum]